MANILFISTKSDWGGSEPLWCDAVERALHIGHSVSVVIPHCDKLHRRHEEIRSKGAKLILRPHRKHLNYLQRLERKRKGEKNDWEMTWWAVRFSLPPHAICICQGGAFCAFQMPGLVDWLAAQPRKYIILCQSTRVPLALSAQTREKILGYYSKAWRVGFTANGNLREMEMRLASRIPNAFVHQNPLDFPTSNPVQWVKSEIPLISCPSRFFIEDKGQDILLQVLARPEWETRKFRLQFFGEGPDEEYVRALADHLGVLSKVDFCGQTEGMLPIWKQTQLMVLPSRSEGLPLVLAGAMAAGRPSVVTDVGGNAEWVRNGVDGFVANAAALGPVAEALERAWMRRSEWPEIGNSARERFLKLRARDPVLALIEMMEQIAAA
jgi:glycosyltransferase involved in cell wall biosynthesis